MNYNKIREKHINQPVRVIYLLRNVSCGPIQNKYHGQKNFDEKVISNRRTKKLFNLFPCSC
jgi:hypothetical protein